jgi:hypothetical protein
MKPYLFSLSNVTADQVAGLEKELAKDGVKVTDVANSDPKAVQIGGKGVQATASYDQTTKVLTVNVSKGEIKTQVIKALKALGGDPVSAYPEPASPVQAHPQTHTAPPSDYEPAADEPYAGEPYAGKPYSEFDEPFSREPYKPGPFAPGSKSKED